MRRAADALHRKDPPFHEKYLGGFYQSLDEGVEGEGFAGALSLDPIQEGLAVMDGCIVTVGVHFVEG